LLPDIIESTELVGVQVIAIVAVPKSRVSGKVHGRVAAKPDVVRLVPRPGPRQLMVRLVYASYAGVAPKAGLLTRSNEASTIVPVAWPLTENPVILRRAGHAPLVQTSLVRLPSTTVAKP
jgi:hypothetical protein